MDIKHEFTSGKFLARLKLLARAAERLRIRIGEEGCGAVFCATGASLRWSEIETSCSQLIASLNDDLIVKIAEKMAEKMFMDGTAPYDPEFPGLHALTDVARKK